MSLSTELRVDAARAMTNAHAAAAALAKPLAKTAQAETSWRLSCSSTFIECFGELIVYALAAICLLFGLVLGWRRYRGRREAGYRKVSMRGSESRTELLHATEMEEGGVVDMENFAAAKPVGRPSRPGHRRNLSLGSTYSVDTLDDDDGVDIDDYAPLDMLTEMSIAAQRMSRDVAVKVKEVVPEMSEVQAAVHMAKMNIQTVVQPSTTSPKATPKAGASLSPVRDLERGVGSPERVLEPTTASEELDLGGSLAELPRSRPLSSLHKVTLAWRGVLRGDGVGEGGGEPRLMVDELLEALNVAMSVCENFGSLMAPAVKNDKANFDKVRAAQSPRLAATSRPSFSHTHAPHAHAHTHTRLTPQVHASRARYEVRGRSSPSHRRCGSSSRRRSRPRSTSPAACSRTRPQRSRSCGHGARSPSRPACSSS